MVAHMNQALSANMRCTPWYNSNSKLLRDKSNASLDVGGLEWAVCSATKLSALNAGTRGRTGTEDSKHILSVTK